MVTQKGKKEKKKKISKNKMHQQKPMLKLHYKGSNIKMEVMLNMLA